MTNNETLIVSPRRTDYTTAKAALEAWLDCQDFTVENAVGVYGRWCGSAVNLSDLWIYPELVPSFVEIRFNGKTGVTGWTPPA